MKVILGTVGLVFVLEAIGLLYVSCTVNGQAYKACFGFAAIWLACLSFMVMRSDSSTSDEAKSRTADEA